jgi:hypothetical protein
MKKNIVLFLMLNILIFGVYNTYVYSKSYSLGNGGFKFEITKKTSHKELLKLQKDLELKEIFLDFTVLKFNKKGYLIQIEGQICFSDSDQRIETFSSKKVNKIQVQGVFKNKKLSAITIILN